MAHAGLLSFKEPRSHTSLWQQQDSMSTGMREILVGGFLMPRQGGGALRSSPQWEAGPGGQGRWRTAPEPSVTAAPEGAEQGPGAPPAPPSTEGKGIARGQLFTVRGWPFLAGPSGRLPTEGSPPALARGEAPPAQSSRAAEAGAQDACRWNSKLLVGGSSPGETPRVHCTSPRLHTQLQLSAEHKHRN